MEVRQLYFNANVNFLAFGRVQNPREWLSSSPQFLICSTSSLARQIFIFVQPSSLPILPEFLSSFSNSETLFIAQITLEFAVFSERLIKVLLLRLSCIQFALVALNSSHLTLRYLDAGYHNGQGHLVCLNLTRYRYRKHRNFSIFTKKKTSKIISS